VLACTVEMCWRDQTGSKTALAKRSTMRFCTISLPKVVVCEGAGRAEAAAFLQPRSGCRPLTRRFRSSESPPVPQPRQTVGPPALSHAPMR